MKLFIRKVKSLLILGIRKNTQDLVLQNKLLLCKHNDPVSIGCPLLFRGGEVETESIIQSSYSGGISKSLVHQVKVCLCFDFYKFKFYYLKE